MVEIGTGLINPPKVTVAYDDASEQYTFTQENDNGFALADDKVYAALFETGLKRVRLVPMRSRGENGSTSFALPEDWDSANVKAYCFATFKNGRAASDGRYLEIV